MRPAMRRRVKGGKCGVMRRRRLASEKESWWGCRFSISSTITTPESWPATTDESGEREERWMEVSTGWKWNEADRLMRQRVMDGKIKMFEFYFSLVEIIGGREIKVCHKVWWALLRDGAVKTVLHLASAAPCHCHTLRRFRPRSSVASCSDMADRPCCSASPPGCTEICWTYTKQSTQMLCLYWV